MKVCILQESHFQYVNKIMFMDYSSHIQSHCQMNTLRGLTTNEEENIDKSYVNYFFKNNVLEIKI